MINKIRMRVWANGFIFGISARGRRVPGSGIEVLNEKYEQQSNEAAKKRAGTVLRELTPICPDIFSEGNKGNEDLDRMYRMNGMDSENSVYSIKSLLFLPPHHAQFKTITVILFILQNGCAIADPEW